MNCKQCGGNITESDQYCPHCGASNPYYVKKQPEVEPFIDPFANEENETDTKSSGIDSIRSNYNGCSESSKNTVEHYNEKEEANKNDRPSFGLALLSFAFPLVGWIMYFIFKSDKPKMAKQALNSAWFGVFCSIFLCILAMIIS